MQRRGLLICGDIAALAAFGMLGLASHEKSVDFSTVARSLAPFVVAWLCIGPVFGAFSLRAVAGEFSLGRMLAAWLVAGITGLLARSVVFDRELFNAFFVIALAGNGLFLSGWRAIYNRWVARASGAETSANPGANPDLRTEQT